MPKRCRGPATLIGTQQGYTLIEMLIAMALSTLLLATVVNAFINQRKTYAIREQVAAMQDNARGGLDFIVRDLAMAGYDPTGSAGAGIVAASEHAIQVTMDLNSDGDTDDAGEVVAYELYPVHGKDDLALGRQMDGAYQLVAANVHNLSLRYTLADGSSTVTPPDPNQIRAIDVALTATTGGRHGPYAAHRTLLLSTTVRVRNMGLER